MNTDSALSIILDEVYQNSDIFRKYLHGVLTKFNFFRTPIGTFRQLGGLAMGSCVSALISNIFVNFFEQEVIKPLIKGKKIISWLRFADDTLAIIKKGIIGRNTENN